MSVSSRTINDHGSPGIDSAETVDLRIRLLGAFEVSIGDRLIPDDTWRLQKAAALIKVLALAPGHRLHRDQVLDQLWPDLDPQSAANNLHYTLHVTRRSIAPAAPSVLRLRDGILRLGADERLWVDVDEFEARAVVSRRDGVLGTYRETLALYRGDLLPQDLYEDWLVSRRESLRSLHLSLLGEFSRLAVAQGNPLAAIDALQRALRSDSGLEEVHVELMGLYARLGQRQQALRQYHQLEVALEELGVGPDTASIQLYEAIRDGQIPGAPVSDTLRVEPLDAPHNLPAPISSFVGREAEIDETKRLLEEFRLVTIVGPGGVGKTRLATEVARSLDTRYRDGVWLVRLAPLSNPDLVPQAVGRVLGLSEQPHQDHRASLECALASKDMLLVLDNCEHVVEACARLAQQLLNACPLVRIMATSRDMLGVLGEVVQNVAPFATPDPDSHPAITDLLEMDAVRLLVERIRYRQPSFSLTGENMLPAVEICRQVEGLPLAIELAAARVGTLSLEHIAARLSDAMGFLTSNNRISEPRHRSLEATLDWSYDLLTPGERSMFERLSVFAGGWTLEAAEVIGAGDECSETVLDVLSRLVDQSLVLAEVMPGGEVRYRMLAPVRQYASQHLTVSGNAEAVHQRHAALFLALACQAEPQLHGPEQVRWLERLSVERDNLRAALRWYAARDTDIHLGLQLAGNLWQFWYIRGHLREGREWLQTMLSCTSNVCSLDRATALRGAGILASAQGEYEPATAHLEAALQMYRQLGADAGAGSCLNSLGIIACEQGCYQRAVALHEEALALRKRLGDDVDIAASLLNLGFAVNMQGDRLRSRQLHENALALGREGGNTALVALCLHNLGYIAMQHMQYNEAVPLLMESLTLTYQVGEQRRLASCLEGLATAALEGAQPRRSARLYGAAGVLRETIGAPMYEDEQGEWEIMIAKVRSALGESAFVAAWDEGRQMSTATAVAYGLETSGEAEEYEAPAAEPSPDARVGQILTVREREIIDLVACGLTSRAIGTQLGITGRTVDTHVGKILRKLGLSSRAEAAAWLIQNDR